MEGRVQAELGLSVNTMVTTVLNQSGGEFPPLPTPSGPTPTPPVAASPTPSAPQTPAATPAPLQPLGYRVNAPLLAVNAGDAQLDANHWAMVSFGKVSTDNNYGDLRIVGRNDGVMLRAQLFDNRATGSDSLTVELNGVQKQVTFSTAVEVNGWELGNRCQDGWCRGWSAFAFFPWSDFGGKPGAGAVWPLRVLFADADLGGAASQAAWPPVGNGTVRWGLPNYGGRSEAGAQVIKAQFNADSMVGGGTDCGPDDYPDYFPSWGNRNYGAVPYANTQMQWDIADWPCYAKYYASWSLADLPAGAQVISATVEMRQFGNPGYGSGYAEDGTKDTVIQVFDVDKPWEEMGISWDNAPVPMENTARTLVKPIDVTCGGKSYCSPGIPYTFDVTEIVKRAQADGRNWASLALYTAAGQYHSGKFFWSREGQEPPVVSMAYVMGAPVQPQPLPDSPVLLFLPAVKGGHN
jgi:hypothetical protein